ncbi:MAG: YkgJ family cysteine cluster protein [Dehalococcoidia bacterium]|nr:YkgJ family cysteine cluster protein [Dehalococcoidia bacterium]
MLQRLQRQFGRGRGRPHDPRDRHGPRPVPRTRRRGPHQSPLAQPFLLAREGGHCRFLGPELGCTVYTGRPNACRLYPHFVVFVDDATGKVTTPSPGDARRALNALLAGQPLSPVPLLLGHAECPGFTGNPLAGASWRTLLEVTYQLQYEGL